MLTIPRHLLVLNVSSNGFQDYLLHHLPRAWGKADWLFVLGTLLALLEDRSHICLLPKLRNLPTSPQHCKDNQKWHHKDISQFPCTPSGSMDLYLSGSKGKASALKQLPWEEHSLWVFLGLSSKQILSACLGCGQLSSWSRGVHSGPWQWICWAGY